MARSTKSQNKKKSEGPEKAADVADKPVVVQKEVKGSNSDLSNHPKFAKFKQGAKK